MTAKEYFSQIRLIDCSIDSKLEQLTQLRSTATKATVTLSNMPRSDSPNVQQMESAIVKIVDLERTITDSIDKLVDLKAEAVQLIGCLGVPEQRLVLELRYLGYETWSGIAENWVLACAT